jgi:hypothetical protein
MTQPGKNTAAAAKKVTNTRDAAGKPLNPNDDMQLNVVDDDEVRGLGLDNAVRNSDAGDMNENTNR